MTTKGRIQRLVPERRREFTATGIALRQRAHMPRLVALAREFGAASTLAFARDMLAREILQRMHHEQACELGAFPGELNHRELRAC